jgi:hypothetical protein
MKTWLLKNMKHVVYGAFGLVTAVTFIILSVWASASVKGEQTVQAEIISTAEARTEYILGEEFDPTGVSMQVGEKEIGADKYTFDADFSSAGLKAVALTYKSGNTVYEAKYPVEVFAVRHLDVRKKEIEKNRDGGWDLSDLIIWAELSGPSSEFEKPEQFSALKDTAIVLNENLYTIEITESSHESFYRAKVNCGVVQTEFGFSTNPDAYVQDEMRILDFTNESGGNEKLTLFVTNNSNNFIAPNGSNSIEVSGIYVYEDGEGNKTEYNFSYAINGWTSTFKSAAANPNGGLEDRQDGDDMLVTVGGVSFRGAGAAWRKAVLNM